jgi:hypothetical protein
VKGKQLMDLYHRDPLENEEHEHDGGDAGGQARI